MDRRRFVSLAGLAATGSQTSLSAQGFNHPAISRTSGVTVPRVGMGSWLTFDIPAGELWERTQRRQVLERFFAAGGGMIDSSPMYGGAERLIGDLLAEVDHAGKLYCASKIWTPFDRFGAGQLDASLKLWRQTRLDLVLVHNLLNWQSHLKMLRRAKEEGKVGAIGISTSHGRGHEEAVRIIKAESLDVLQITYNLADASAEYVMDAAADRGMAVVINRPYDGGALFASVRRVALPAWAVEFDCRSWAEYFLKWVLGRSAVTCVIPATRNPSHMEENMSARVGRLPDESLRRRMQAFYRAL